MCSLFRKKKDTTAAIIAQMQAEEQRRIERENAAKAEAERLRVEQERAAQEAKTDAANRAAANRSAAMSAARTRAMKSLESRGVNPYDYMDTIDERLNYNASLLPATTEDFTGQFGDSFVDAVTSSIRDKSRNQATRWFDTNIAPNYEETLFSSTMDDPYVDSILGRQKQEALDTVTRARSRGQLDELGFTGAVNRIGELEKSGRSTAQSLSDAVLANKRSDLRKLIDQGKSAAGSLELGQTFNPQDWSGRIQSKAKELGSSIEGDVYGALSGQQFFDIGDVITKGGQAQGVSNPTPAFLDAQASREQLRQKQRGAGQGGTF